MTAARGALPEDLLALADAYGVLTTYVEHGGARRFASAEPLVAVLEAIGVDGAGSDPRGALVTRRAELASRLVDVVSVVQAGPGATVSIAAPPGESVECVLVFEDSTTREWSCAVAPPENAAGQSGVISLIDDVPVGYHRLTVRARRREGQTVLLARPAEGARGRFGDDWRAVGIAAPLFTLHSETSWGCGDLGDLDSLASLAAAHGTTVVSTLPLLAGFGPEPFEPSPYLPVSRQFWHERWIDMGAVDGLTASSRAAELASKVRASTRDAASRLHPLVDGAGSLAAKRAVLEVLVEELVAEDGARSAALASYLADRPGLLDYARFRAAGERFGIDFDRWPAALRSGHIEMPDVDDDSVRFHALAQMIVHEQLTSVAERCEQRGQVLSLDLPLGVHPRGFEIWRHRDQFVSGVSVGAPPDRFFPRGQGWSFLPTRVEAARASGHALFRAALGHHLNVASMLRIDHVIGMQRLFWVPDGAEPADGVYVTSPLEELLAVVSIEAQRHRAAIVGEDLGTVDAEVRHAMARDGIRRTFVVELFIEPDGEPVIATPPPGSVASFATHDLPTFAGWWLGRDIDERVALGQVDDEMAAVMARQRHAERSRLGALAPSSDGEDVPLDVLAAALDELAISDAGLVVAQLDDLLGERDAVNLPGTSTERANWQRRTALSLEDAASDLGLASTLGALATRRPATTPPGGGRGGRVVETVFDVTRFGEVDDYLFAEGRHARLYDKLGAHEMAVNGKMGTYFAVWAPNAAWVEVIGDFNGWDGHRHPLARREHTGVWEGFVIGVGLAERYKFRLESSVGGEVLDKADPFARRAELAPGTASITSELRHVWGDARWMTSRAARQELGAPLSIYEVHLGSWRHVPEDEDRSLTYSEAAPRLIEHATRHGFTHVELLPVMEHPFYASWGYHVTGFFAPSARYGDADDFAALVDELHAAGLGIVLDWVPAHFPDDAFALAAFDGTHLFEHADPRQARHPDWDSLIFNYARHEVRSFLLSAACYWLERFHVDGLRFDAVASMLYLDYSREPGEWVPNRLGGRENLDAIELLTTTNDEIHRNFPGVVTIAEESTSWPGVTATTEAGGLGFDYKWDLGWMHDTLDYLARDPVHRKWHHDQLTFRSLYATSEQFLLPLSHDEVVHGKGSLLARMPGDHWQRYANLRLLFGFQLAQPGKKLLFMGDEIGQEREWAHERSVDWHLLDRPEHRGIDALVVRLNALYRGERSLHCDDRVDRGFAWIDGDDREQSVFCIERFDGRGSNLVIVLNATPEPRLDYLVGMPVRGTWSLLMNSDHVSFGGSGFPVPPTVETEDAGWHGRDQRATMVLPPLGFVVYANRHR